MHEHVLVRGALCGGDGSLNGRDGPYDWGGDGVGALHAEDGVPLYETPHPSFVHAHMCTCTHAYMHTCVHAYMQVLKALQTAVDKHGAVATLHVHHAARACAASLTRILLPVGQVSGWVVTYSRT